MNDYELTELGFDEDENRLYVCPLCGDTIKVKSNVFYGRCPACKLTIIDYQPAPHQVNFHKSKAKFRLNIGGFGSGKTTSSVADIVEHILTVPGGKTLLTAPIIKQVREAVIPELNKFLPPWLMARKPRMSPSPYYKMKNGHEIVVFASNDEENLRSLNLSAFYIEEASAVSFAIFQQLKTRLRNNAAVKKDKYGRIVDTKFMGIVCTNPETGWIRDKFLLMSDKIFASESIDSSVYDRLVVAKPEKSFHTFLSSSRDNAYLHPTFIPDMCAGQSREWIRKYIDCYLDVKEGVVYKRFMQHIVEPFSIPQNWMRLGGFDKGYADETAMPIGAIDPDSGIIYVYLDYYVKEEPMSYHIKHIKPLVKPFNFLYPIQADPTVRNRNERDGTSYADYFLAKSGIYLEPADNAIIAGIEKVRDYMYAGKLKFFSSCVNLIKEATTYEYAETKDGVNINEKVKDKNNHLMDALRYMIKKLPEDPMELQQAVMSQGIYSNGVLDSDREALIAQTRGEVDTSNVYGYGRMMKL